MGHGREQRLTIVIPVHNMAGRLENLKKSITGARGESTTFVLVVDGIQDSTFIELREFANANPDIGIHLIHGDYSSPGLARNAGLECVLTPFVMFADSDDLFFIPVIAEALERILPETEVLIGGFKQTDLLNNKTIINLPENPLFFNLAMNPGLWRIVIRKSIATEVKFREYLMAEDQLWMAQTKILERKIEVTNQIFYHYFANGMLALTSNSLAKRDLELVLSELDKLASRSSTNNAKYVNTIFAKIWVTTFLNTKSLKSRKNLLFIFVRQALNRPSALVYGSLVILESAKKRFNKRFIEKNIYLPLAGGLGNQLFQYAHAFTNHPRNQILIESSIFTPRTNSFGEPELLDFRLPGNIQVLHNLNTFSKFLRKGSSVLLRIGSGNLPSGVKFLVLSAARPFVTILARISLGEWMTVKVATDVGYSKISTSKTTTLFIGYFQSYRWLEENPELIESIKFLRPTELSLETATIINESKSRNILGIHIRLGDYVQEERIGILPKEYYEKGLEVLNHRTYDEVWIFTNDVDGAKNLVPNLRDIQQVWIPGHLSSAETLHLMSFCTDFIISNSTFSWWGAYMNQKSQSMIVCPKKWFEKAPDPIDICPPYWIRVNSF